MSYWECMTVFLAEKWKPTQCTSCFPCRSKFCVVTIGGGITDVTIEIQISIYIESCNTSLSEDFNCTLPLEWNQLLELKAEAGSRRAFEN